MQRTFGLEVEGGFQAGNVADEQVVHARQAPGLHATAGEVSAVSLEAERGALDTIPPPNGGLVLRGPARL
jgi:hypothetical protein